MDNILSGDDSKRRYKLPVGGVASEHSFWRGLRRCCNEWKCMSDNQALRKNSKRMQNLRSFK